MLPESMLEKLMWGAGILATAACMAARAHAAIVAPTVPAAQIEQVQTDPGPAHTLAN